jgi:hypothetical protein
MIPDNLNMQSISIMFTEHQLNKNLIAIRSYILMKKFILKKHQC